MFKVLLWGLAIYLLYRFIFGLVIPVTKTASQIKQKMTEMQQQQQQAFEQQEFARKQTQPNTKETNSTQAKKDDYLDFEEVK
jgi:hypothetical protein